MTVQTCLRIDGLFVAVDEVTRLPDPDAVDGSIRLVLNGTALLGDDDWDEVDCLWGYLVYLLSDLQASDEARTRLPNRAVTVTLTRTRPGWVRVRVDRPVRPPVEVEASVSGVVDLLRGGAEHFLRHYRRLDPGAVEAIDQLQHVLESLPPT